jgi:uncharacterized protein with PIN domain
MKSLKMLLFAALTMISFAAFSQEKAGRKDTAQHIQLYTCPMHDTVVMKQPGNCPICGMKLEFSAKEQMKSEVTKTYSCPIHTDVQSDKPGKCSKCGSNLTLSPKEKMKVDVMNNYSCPMHSNVKADKPGKCAYCGMKLTELKKKTTSDNQ